MFKMINNRKLPIWNAIALALLVMAGIVLMNMLYLNGNEDDILFNSCLFLLIVFINRFSLDLSKYKGKLMLTLLVDLTEQFFLIYLVFVFMNGTEYFVQYKVLMLPAFLLGIFLLSTLIGWRRVNDHANFVSK